MVEAMCKRIEAVTQRKQVGLVPDTPVAKSITKAINIAVVCGENKDGHSETLKLFQNVYSFCIYCEFPGYVTE